MAGNQFERHGKKRHAEDELENNHSISTQFKKLRLNHASPRAYLNSFHESQSPPAPSVEYMPVDETPDRVVIHDLDAEIREIEAAESQTLFLPDIDKKVSAIPQKLLQNRSENTNTQLVLYKVPSSISVPKEEDAVRKAIAAARARARERQALERARNGVEPTVLQTTPVSKETTTHYVYDPDEMDIG